MYARIYSIDKSINAKRFAKRLAEKQKNISNFQPVD